MHGGRRVIGANASPTSGERRCISAAACPPGPARLTDFGVVLGLNIATTTVTTTNTTIHHPPPPAATIMDANADPVANGGIAHADNAAAVDVNAPVADANAQAAVNAQEPTANGPAQGANNPAGLILGETINALAAQGVAIAAAMGATLQRIQRPDWDPLDDGALDMQAGIAAVLDEEAQVRGIELIAAVREAMIRDLSAAMEVMGDRVIGRFGRAPRRQARVRRADAEKWGPKAREGRGDGAGQDGPGGSGAAGSA